MLHLAGVLGRSPKIRSFDASFALGAARARQYREIRRVMPPTHAQPDGHSIQLRTRETSRALRRRPERPRVTTAAAQSATRHAGGPHSHALRRRQPARPRATPAAAQSASATAAAAQTKTGPLPKQRPRPNDTLHQLAEEVLDILDARIARIAGCAGVGMSGLGEEVEVLFL